MPTFEEYRNRFSRFYRGAKEAREDATRPHAGHGLDHDATVAMLADCIAPDPHTAAKAWCAAFLHSFDRMENDGKEGFELRVRMCASELGRYFSNEEVEEIVQAALRHSEKNRSDQSLTQQVLMDADRLANLQPLVIIRAGQLQPGIASIEFDHVSRVNPASTYNEPRSIIDDLRIMISEYRPQFRLPKAIELRDEYIAELETFIARVIAEQGRLGLADIEL